MFDWATVSCILKGGVVSIDAVVYVGDSKDIVINEQDIAREIIRKCPCPIASIAPSQLLPSVVTCLRACKRAVLKIESCALNPYTSYGRNKLLKEFTLLITDDNVAK